MEKRTLGANGLETSAAGLGCMGMSEFYGATDDDEARCTIAEAIDRGVTMLDTSDAYGKGDNEKLVGRAVRGRRERVVIATKFGIVRSPFRRTHRDGSAAYVKKACEASLRRLGVETIDLYYVHRLDPKVPVEETIGAMAELVKAGKVRHLGMSEVSSATLRRAHAVHPIAAIQNEYSLLSRDPEADILRTCRDIGCGLVAYSPLGRGLLAGRFDEPGALTKDDSRATWPRFTAENLPANLSLAARLDAIARRKGCTRGQLAIAWVLAQGRDVVALWGTKRRRYLEENLGATEVTLDAADLAELDAAFPPGAAAGTRYPAAMLEGLGG